MFLVVPCPSTDEILLEKSTNDLVDTPIHLYCAHRPLILVREFFPVRKGSNADSGAAK